MVLQEIATMANQGLEWRRVFLIDTGGYVVGEDIFEQEIDKQVELAIDEADAIIFMVEVETGLTGMDEEVAQLLRKAKTCFSSRQ